MKLALLSAFLALPILSACGGAIPKPLEELADDSAEALKAGADLSNVCAKSMDDRRDLRIGKIAPCPADDAGCKAAAEAEAKEADGYIAVLREKFCKYTELCE